MENVSGILTKEKGKIKDRILKEIKDLIDYNHLSTFVSICNNLKEVNTLSKENREDFSICLKLLTIWIEENKLITLNRNNYLDTLKEINHLTLNNEQKNIS